ncbi:MAG: SDR family oxidoreductase [Acidobacteria bacterium]|nr:MAG: SDR family oxidoreductase [Acidobacteriota bacterium]
MTSKRPRRIILTGASRGLGLEFTRSWLAAGHHVFALARSASTSDGLAKLAADHGDALHRLDMTVADEQSVVRTCEQIGETWDAADLLLNNAGIYKHKGDTLADLDLDDCLESIKVNTLGPIRMARALRPLLRKGNQPRIINMTSLMGSLADNSSGGSWGYRMSKTALNMASRNMAHELASDGIIAVVIHPGWVRTDMGGVGAPLTIEEAVASMTRAMDNFTIAQAGGFYDRNGAPLPW